MALKVVPKIQWRYPLSLERVYAKLLVAHVQRMFKVINAFLPEIRDVILSYAVKLDADDDNTTVNAHIDILIDQLIRATENHTAMLPVIRRMFDQVDRYNQQEWDAITKSMFGMPLRSNAMVTMKQDADEDDIAKLKDIWVQQNLDLISSIDEETMQKIRDRMAERIIQNVDSASLTKYLIQDIKDIGGVEVNRATLIGADQVGKLNGRLSQYRQQHAGVDEYNWSSCHDSRVRPAHAARDGHIYAWNNPPPDGNPGHPIRCRCVALPVIDLDKIGLQAKKNSFIPVGGNGIITPRSGGILEQAKKRDHKIDVTDVAIDKVPRVDVPEFSLSLNETIQDEHKNILRIAKDKNNHNEVLSVMSVNGSRKAVALGSEYHVDPSSNPEAQGIFISAGRKEMALH
jgi:SPP1 gp7 family putative phage head morphogenesis protein